MPTRLLATALLISILATPAAARRPQAPYLGGPSFDSAWLSGNSVFGGSSGGPSPYTGPGYAKTLSPIPRSNGTTELFQTRDDHNQTLVPADRKPLTCSCKHPRRK